MATLNSNPTAQTSTTADLAPRSRQEHYTGVVVIHGLGAVKRNTTLEEAVNTLAYWLNHKAGLSLRREGTGRIWVRAQLTDDPNPDAPAARASMQLTAAPGDTITSALASETTLRLQFREVWWAESFGVPSVGATISWAWVQAWEQATHLLLPIGKRLGPAQTAQRTPARQILQALTYRPSAETQATSPRAASQKQGGAEDSGHAHFTQWERILLQGALALYGLMQYVWKALQWLILTPLILLLLLVMGPLRLLVAIIPPLQSSVAAGLSVVLNTIMLHWVAEAQVYTQDYTRSAGIRDRFERELRRFLRDPRCDRIVVIAHSMGTVIAYEGLTTVLDRPQFRDGKKPVTFICLAQALRRVWLMSADDPGRLRGVLPDWVRWVHFWARYDPVTAGPLSRNSLPRLKVWADPAAPNPYEALAAQLGGCENVDVVNTDSAFTDHTTYWQNLEQVAGPIAKELVTGHPVLEQVVQKHLATDDDILRRRAQVAWRSTVALAAGFGLGYILFVWDSGQGWKRVGQTLATSFLKFLTDLLGAVANTFSGVLGDLQTIVKGLTGGSSLSISLGAPITATTADEIWSIAAALVLAGIGILVVGRVLALRSPLAFERSVPETEASAWTLLALAGAYLSVPVAAGVLYALRWSSAISNFLFLFGPLFGVLVLVIAITSSSRNRQLRWETAMLLLTAPFAVLVANLYVPGGPVGGSHAIGVYINYSSSIELAVFSGVVIAVAGCLLYLRLLAQGRRFGSFAFLLLVGLLLVYYGLAYVFVLADSALHSPTSLQPASYFFSFAGFNFDSAIIVGGVFIPAFVYAPVLMYALVHGTRELGIRSLVSPHDLGLVSFPVAALVLLNATSFVSAALVATSPLNVSTPVQAVLSAAVVLTSFLVILMGLFALGRAVDHAVRMRRWGWLIVILLALLSLLALSLTLASDVSNLATAFTASSSVAALIYGLWASPPQRLSGEPGIRRLPMSRLNLAHVAAGVVVAVVVSLFVWEAFLAIPAGPKGLELAEFPIHTTIKPGVQGLLLPLSAAPSVSIVGAPVASLSSVSEPEEMISDSAGNLWFIAAGTGEIGRIAFPGLSVELFDLHDPGSRPQGLTFGPGGDLWFTDIGTGKIGYLSPNALPSPITGPVREFSLPTPNRKPFDIVAGPDGNLWFTEMGPGKIGRMTPQGVVTEFAIPTPNSAPAGITRGPDGNLWFTEMGPGKIGRITISGAIKEYALLNPASKPVHFATDAKGNLWFTEAGDGKIGRITPQGVIGEIQLPNTDSQPEGITIDSTGNLWFTEIGTHKIGLLTPSGQYTDFSLATVENTISATTPFGIVALPGGNVWFTDKSTGAIGEIKASINTTRLSEPHAIVAGPDGNIWFTDVGTGKIGLISPAGNIVEIPSLPASSQPEGITVGPDGNLWFTEAGTGKIGRITPSGTTLPEFSLRNPTSEPWGIVTGPDGNIWFTDVGTGAIGRMTLKGRVTEFTLSYPGSEPDEITVGPDGNLWFTEAAVGRIGRITPQGQVLDEFSLNPASNPFGIVAGPDGNLWFTEEAVGRIGRITPQGDLQEFSLPKAGSEPEGITVGPDGNLWFTEAGSGKIGRITPEGSITEFALADAASQPYAIVTGPDGNLWFTEAGSHAIGHAVTRRPIWA